jgi:hypothetical protein
MHRQQLDSAREGPKELGRRFAHYESGSRTNMRSPRDRDRSPFIGDAASSASLSARVLMRWFTCRQEPRVPWALEELIKAKKQPLLLRTSLSGE